MFFTVLWALWHRLWLTAVALFLVPGVIEALAVMADLGAPVRAVIDLGLLVVIGLFANDWRRLVLAKRGFEEVGVVAAQDLDAAELRAAERLGLDVGVPALAPSAR
jgi:hypothetical protein